MPIKDWSTYKDVLDEVYVQYKEAKTKLAIYLQAVETTDPSTNLHGLAKQGMEDHGIHVAHLLCMADALLELIPPELLDPAEYAALAEAIVDNVRPDNTVETVLSTDN
jgi:hypothetical protein